MTRASRFRSLLTAWGIDVAIAVLGFCLTAILVFVDLGNGRERERRTFERGAESRVADISRTQGERTRNDQIIADLFEASGSLPEDRFVKFAASHPPGFRRAIEFVPRVRDADRARFEAELRNAHPAAVGIWETGPDGERRPAATRADLFPVRYMHPVGDMESVFGFDLGSEPIRRQALEKAARTGQLTISEPIRLVEEPSRWAYLRYVPLYEQGLAAGTPDERREALRGFVVAVYRFGDVFDAAMESAGATRQIVYIYADDRPDALPVYTYKTRDTGTNQRENLRLAEARALPAAYVSMSHVSDRNQIHVFVPSSPAPIWRLADTNTAIIVLLGLALTAATVIARQRARREIAAAAAGEERTKQILDAIPDIAFMKDSAGRYTSANRALVKLVGASNESNVLGKAASDFFPPYYAELFQADDRRVLQLGETILNREEPSPDSSGQERLYLTNRVPIRGGDGTVVGLVGISRDVTDRHRQEMLHRTELEITRVLSESSEMEDGVRRVLAVIGTDLGWNYGELKLVSDYRWGGSPAIVWHDGSADMIRFEEVSRDPGLWEKSPVVARARQLRGAVWLEDLPTSDAERAAAAGRAGLQSAVTVPLFSENQAVGLISLGSKARRPLEPDTVAMLTDVGAGVGQLIARTLAQAELRAERNSLAQRVDERTVELQEANADLARASRMKDEFLASMSHELRTPLNAVLGLSEALQEKVYGPLTERQEQSLRTIEESGRHLLALINDILDLSKIEAGKLDLQRGPVDVAAVCHSVLRMIRPAAQEKSHSLTLSMEPTDVRAYGDPRRLKQILINLLSNAVKFTEPGGSIALEVTEEERSVRFSVRDTGIGISKSDLPRLFKPFVQLDSSLGRRHGGSGLGLALVGRLAELHGGSVALESEPGRGTTVSVSVPSWATFQSTQSVPSTLET